MRILQLLCLCSAGLQMLNNAALSNSKVHLQERTNTQTNPNLFFSVPGMGS